MEETVEFSASKITFVNDYEELKDTTEAIRRKCTYFVQNKSSTSKNVRVSVHRDNDQVSCTTVGS